MFGVFIGGLVIGFAAGLWWSAPAPGAPQIPRSERASSSPPRPAQSPRQTEPGRSPGVLDLLRAGRSDASLDLLEALERELTPVEHRRMRDQVIEELRGWSDRERLEVALRVARDYQRRYLHDAALLGLLADIYQLLGRTQDALDPLFGILAYPPSAAVAEATRDRIRLLERTHANGLSQRREYAALVAFYGHLLSLDPQNDRYRIAQAEWLAEIGEYRRAEILLDQVSVAWEQDVAGMRARVGLLEAGIPIVRQGNRLIAEARIGNRPVNLLIDTGATMTALSPVLLRRLGARRSRDQARVVTAAGPVTAPIFVIDEFVIGDKVFSDLPVLGLELGDAGVDGLLGMDVLRATGLPRLDPSAR